MKEYMISKSFTEVFFKTSQKICIGVGELILLRGDLCYKQNSELDM